MALFSAVNFSEEVQAARQAHLIIGRRLFLWLHPFASKLGPTLDRASVPLYIGGSRCYTLKILP